MIHFKRHILKNGLRVIVHEDKSTPICAVNLLYKVGSKNEKPDKTGLAHLFEHLMFSGSKNVKDFDKPIQQAGGENNAFTNNDITNYYCILPSQNLDIALWLESDRMANLTITQKKLENQKSVVIEEFKETCLNEPYGDVWHHLSSLVFKKHPYKWPVIGSEIAHISSVYLEDANDFFHKHYHPGNAVLCIAGPLDFQKVVEKVSYWFEDIPGHFAEGPVLEMEEEQHSKRFKLIEADVPADSIYMAFRMADRMSADYFKADLISDILSNGRSSRLYQELVKKKELFTHIDAYITSTVDPGMLIIEGKLSGQITLENAENAIWEVLHNLKSECISERELGKLKNKVESTLIFSEMGVMHKAINLAYFEALGDADLINREVAMYRSISSDDIQLHANTLLRPENCSVLYYRKLQ
jgi:zinc protease